jgi:HPt (histidine-containing phosphotransfer) domain-containing protein
VRPALDVSLALNRMGGDQDLLCMIAGLFLEEAPPVLAAIEAPLQAGDPDVAYRQAHKLRGSVSNLAAEF